MNVEASLVEYLGREFEAYADVPVPRPDRFITVERTGGGMDNVVRDTPMVAIQCWAPTRQEASELARDVKDYMRNYVYEPGVSRVSLNSMYNFPAEKDEPRYQIIYDLVTRD